MNMMLEQLLMSPEFENEVKTCKTAEDFQAALKRHNVDISVEEIIELGRKLYVQNEKNGELNESDLEQVSGGGLFLLALSGINVLLIGIYAGTLGM